MTVRGYNFYERFILGIDKKLVMIDSKFEWVFKHVYLFFDFTEDKFKGNPNFEFLISLYETLIKVICHLCKVSSD